MMRSFPLLLIAALGLLLVFALGDSLLTGTEIGPVAQHYLDNGVAETGVYNLVTAVLLDYRALDTLLESAVIFAAAAAVWSLMQQRRLPDAEGGLSVAVRTLIPRLLPLLLVYSVHLALFGHLTPGGGFQGGVVLSVVSVLLIAAFGTGYEYRLISPNTKSRLELLGGGILVVIALAPLVVGATLLTNGGAGFPLGQPGSLFSGGTIPVLSLAIFVKVAAAFSLILYSLLKKGS